MPRGVRSARKVQKALFELSGRLQHVVVPHALHEVAEEIAAEIRRNAPVESGRTRDSVEVVDGSDSDGNPTSEIYVDGGHDDEGTDRAHVVRFVEFGTVHKAANPFIRRAFDAKKAGAESDIRDAIARAVEQSGERSP